MNTKIYIHIGTHKTGTSAIQDFMLLNRRPLARHGILYPQKSRRHYYDMRDGEYVVSEKQFKNYRTLTSLCRAKDKHIVLSSETFSLIKDVSAMKAALGDMPAVIICYLRRQDDVLQSLYNQYVKGGGFYKDIGEFVFSHTLDYYELLDRWAQVFGKEHVVVRPYERQQFYNNDLIADFLSILGLDSTGDYQQLQANANPRLPRQALHYMRLLNSLLCDKKKSKRIKKQLIPYCLERFKDNTESLFLDQCLYDPAQKRAILDRYESSNQRVAREFLGRQDGRLFFASPPADSGPSATPPLPTDETIEDITRHLCRSRAIKKILLGAVRQGIVETADDFTRQAHAMLSKTLNRLR